MESGRVYDINELGQEARKRWLKPSEVIFILRSYSDDQLTLVAPQNPPSGSLFLFNRRVLRFFRKDGYSWRKKKNGKTVGEAHERLKVGNVEALNCYYAHGDQNPNFQRRSYWMLDPARDHIVLVHYRDVTEGANLDAQIPVSSAITNLLDPCQSSAIPGYMEEKLTELLSVDGEDSYSKEKFPCCADDRNLPKPGLLVSPSIVHTFIDNPLGLHYGEQDLSSDMNTGPQDGVSNALFLPSVDSGKQNIQSLDALVSIERKISPNWKEMLEYCSPSTAMDLQEKTCNATQEEYPTSSSITGCQLDDMISHDCLLASSEKHVVSITEVEQPEDSVCLWADDRGNDATIGLTAYQTSESNFVLQSSESEEHPFGCEQSLSPTSGELVQAVENSAVSSYSLVVTTLNANCDEKMLRSTNSIDWMETRHVPLDNRNYCSGYYAEMFDQESLLQNPLESNANLIVSRMQRFTIHEISPEWAHAMEYTKVIVIGDFLCDSSECSWACMFGEIEVPAEVIKAGVLHCYAPPCEAGKVNFCVTAGNRESCSEIREFEYRVKPNTYGSERKLPQGDTTKSSEELALLLRFVGLLLHGYDFVSIHKEDSSQSETEGSRMFKMASDSWREIMEAISVFGNVLACNEIMDWLLQELLKDKLQQWLSSKFHEGDDTSCHLSRQEQGVIHLIAGLGYEWALNPVLKAGVGVNFRDGNGWTALHWAAHFGREKMVAALVAAGASAVAVTDATSQDPVGKNPAAIAASSGHKGLAGYLSELALTSHLSSLTLEESEISKGSAAVEAERAMDSVAELAECSPHSDGEDQLSLKESLAAVRNAAQAASRIQAAFRAHSFKKKQLRALLASYDEYGFDIHVLSSAMKVQWAFSKVHNHKLHNAAVSIQKKYRGWKRRKDFLKLRKNVVKIQAHVRGHQVRKKFKEVLWAVSVLEKAIMRWRRRGPGLRGFRSELEYIDETENEDILKVFRKQKVDAVTEEALARVLSMVESPDARHQYHRIVERFRKLKAQLVSNSSETALSWKVLEDNIEDGHKGAYHV